MQEGEFAHGILDDPANVAANTDIVIINAVDCENVSSLAQSAGYCTCPGNSDRWGSHIRSEKREVVRISADRQILKLPVLKCFCHLRGIRLDDTFGLTSNVNDRGGGGDRKRYIGRRCLVKRNDDVASRLGETTSSNRYRIGPRLHVGK